MIKRVDIKNFQSHESSTLVLDRGVNVIIGLSNSGKSAIVRAIDFVLRNRPLGNKFIKFGKDSSSVRIESSNHNASVERIKGKNKNQYVINSDNSEELVLTAFGSDSPKQVSDALNIQAVNVQRQFSPYFLVFDSPGSVAEYIRVITRTDEIDKVSGVLAKRVRSVSTDLTVVNNQLVDVRTRLDSINLINLDKLERLINAAKKSELVLKTLNDKISSILGVVSDVNRIDEKMVVLPSDIDEVMERSELYVSEYVAKLDKEKDLSGLIFAIQEINSSMVVLPENLDEVIKKLELCVLEHDTKVKTERRLSELVSLIKELDESTIVIPNDVDEIINTSNQTVEEYNTSKQLFGLIMGLVKGISVADETVDALNVEINHEVEELTNLQSQLSNCPMCGSPLDEAGVKRVCGSQLT